MAAKVNSLMRAALSRYLLKLNHKFFDDLIPSTKEQDMPTQLRSTVQRGHHLATLLEEKGMISEVSNRLSTVHTIRR